MKQSRDKRNWGERKWNRVVIKEIEEKENETESWRFIQGHYSKYDIVSA